MTTIKELYGKTATQIAAENDVSTQTVYKFHSQGELAAAIKTGIFTKKNRDIAKYGKSFAQIAVDLAVQPGIVSSMEKFGVLPQAIANAKKLRKT